MYGEYLMDLSHQVAYDDFVAARSLAAAREKGLVSWLPNL